MNSTFTLRWQMLALFVLLCAAFYYLSPVLTPFAIAAMFAYLFDPLADLLERWKLSRTTAVSIVFLALSLVVTLILLLAIPYLSRQVAAFIGHLPQWLAWMQDVALPWLHERFELDFEMPDMQKVITVLQSHWKEAGGIATTVVAGISKSGFAVISWITRLVVIPVAFFYLLRDWDVMIQKIHDLLPRSIEPTVSRLAREADETLSAFVRGQLSVMIVLGILYAIGLWAVGIDVGPLIGLIAGLISFVPYLGSITGILMGVIAALVQYGDVTHVLLVVTVFVIGQLIEGYVLVPRLVGEKIGLHPVAVIFAVLAGGEMFGFLGVLLALPVASVLMVLLRYANERYRASQLYAHESPEAPADAPAGVGEPIVVVSSSRQAADPSSVVVRKGDADNGPRTK
ncbi:MAG: AI-2E family transporter [Rudaea sp.]|uniref:AI-2E family transporter n=1 Tax=unclassified Rudaea TaxID=2627037 RepID=UPI0010F4D827|nr:MULTISPECIES: AI-2E family transporter [unclassified Rudaea]MBN8886454.1 AI-2E family transporter [Rudaea sp.]MBR0346941.1 AI-2E family transporter [Rudaea sp.]